MKRKKFCSLFYCKYQFNEMFSSTMMVLMVYNHFSSKYKSFFLIAVLNRYPNIKVEGLSISKIWNDFWAINSFRPYALTVYSILIRIISHQNNHIWDLDKYSLFTVNSQCFTQLNTWKVWMNINQWFRFGSPSTTNNHVLCCIICWARASRTSRRKLSYSWKVMGEFPNVLIPIVVIIHVKHHTNESFMHVCTGTVSFKLNFQSIPPLHISIFITHSVDVENPPRPKSRTKVGL